MAGKLTPEEEYAIFTPLMDAYHNVVGVSKDGSRNLEAGARTVISAINEYTEAFENVSQKLKQAGQDFDSQGFLGRAEEAASKHTQGRSDYKFAVIRVKLGFDK